MRTITSAPKRRESWLRRQAREPGTPASRIRREFLDQMEEELEAEHPFATNQQRADWVETRAEIQPERFTGVSKSGKVDLRSLTPEGLLAFANGEDPRLQPKRIMNSAHSALQPTRRRLK